VNCRLSLAVSTVSSFGRGRDADCSAPPAQTRVGAFNAHSSYLGCMASKRLLLRARGSQFHFEACSGFTRVTACRVARPPEVTFVTRLQPGLLPDQTACQLPDLPTTIWVGLPPTSDLHIRRSEIRGESKMLWARLLAYVTGTVL